MALTATIKTPVASTFGGFTALPIMSARLSEMAFLAIPDEDFDAAGTTALQLPERCQSIEISVRNPTDEAAVIGFVSVTSEPPTQAHRVALAGVGIVRSIPAEGQVIEHRRAVEDDWLVIQRSSPDVVVTIHCHLDEVQS